MIKEVLAAINQYETIIIHRHTKPDGDAMGSQIGLKHLIQDNFPTKRVFVVGDVNERYAFVGDMDEVADELYKGALAIILDLSAPALVSDERYKLAEKTVRIDHHLYIEKFQDKFQNIY